MNKEVKIFYTSDWHFGHKNIIRYCNRPFDLSDEGVAQCTDFIKKEYCSVVGPDDFVFFLGDAFFGGSKKKYAFRDLVQSMTGKKIMIRGNHDYESDSFYLSCGFLEIENYISFGKYFICHFDLTEKTDDEEHHCSEEDVLREVFKKSGCEFIIHGHTHTLSPVSDDCVRYNVCIDNPKNSFRPVRIKGFEADAVAYLKARHFL